VSADQTATRYVNARLQIEYPNCACHGNGALSVPFLLSTFLGVLGLHAESSWVAEANGGPIGKPAGVIEASRVKIARIVGVRHFGLLLRNLSIVGTNDLLEANI
jgi:hypothetical protein